MGWFGPFGHFLNRNFLYLPKCVCIREIAQRRTITITLALSQNAPKPKKVCLFSSMQLLKIKLEIFWSSIFIHYIWILNAISKGLSPHCIVPRPHGNYLFFVHTLMKDVFLSKMLFRQFGSQKITSFQEKRCQRTSEQKLSMKLKVEGISSHKTFGLLFSKTFGLLRHTL